MTFEAAVRDPVSRRRSLFAPAWRRVLVVGVIAFVVRAIYWAALLHHYQPISDANQYNQLALNLVHGHGFSDTFPQLAVHPTAWRPPLFPFVLGAVYAVFGIHLFLGQLLNALVGSVVVVLVDRLGTRIAGSTAGLVAAAVAAVCPELLANDVTTLSEPLSHLLMVGIILLLLQRRLELAGVASGLLVLARASAQPLIPVLAVWALVHVGCRRALRFTLVAILVVSPWAIRNWIQLGSPVLVTSNGFNLAAAYSPEARQTGSFVDATKDPRFSATWPLERKEVAWDSALTHLSLSELRHHPSELFQVLGRNSSDMFEIRPSTNIPAEMSDGRNLDFRRHTLWFFYIATILGLAGLGAAWRREGTRLLVLVAALFTAGALLVVSPPRLRSPFDLACAVGTGLLVARLRQRGGLRRRSQGRTRRATSDFDDAASRVEPHGVGASEEQGRGI